MEEILILDRRRYDFNIYIAHDCVSVEERFDFPNDNLFHRLLVDQNNFNLCSIRWLWSNSFKTILARILAGILICSSILLLDFLLPNGAALSTALERNLSALDPAELKRFPPWLQLVRRLLLAPSVWPD